MFLQMGYFILFMAGFYSIVWKTLITYFVPLLLLFSGKVGSNSLQPHQSPVAHQFPQSMGFPRQEYWSGLPFPTPGTMEYYSIIKKE